MSRLIKNEISSLKTEIKIWNSVFKKFPDAQLNHVLDVALGKDVCNLYYSNMDVSANLLSFEDKLILDKDNLGHMYIFLNHRVRVGSKIYTIPIHWRETSLAVFELIKYKKGSIVYYKHPEKVLSKVGFSEEFLQRFDKFMKENFEQYISDFSNFSNCKMDVESLPKHLSAQLLFL